MTHASADFTTHMLGLLKNTGPAGPSGPTHGKSFNSNEKVGTSCREEVGPVDFKWSQGSRATGPGKISTKQSVKAPGTSGTTGTTNFQRATDHPDIDRAPADWHAILAELEQQICPEWLAPDRWSALLFDAEIFLSRWRSTAHSLGWTALDLFGVHPIAPAARFDVMGLIPLLQGAVVLTLTDTAAKMRQPSGAMLTYRRTDQSGTVCISRVAA